MPLDRYQLAELAEDAERLKEDPSDLAFRQRNEILRELDAYGIGRMDPPLGRTPVSYGSTPSA